MIKCWTNIVIDVCTLPEYNFVSIIMKSYVATIYFINNRVLILKKYIWYFIIQL